MPSQEHPQRERVRALWEQTDPKLSSAEIGARLGISKNAVVGIAHRMLLTPRESPIRPRGAGAAHIKRAPVPRVRKVTPPVATAPVVPIMPILPPVTPVSLPLVPVAPPPLIAPPPQPRPSAAAPRSRCLWPTWTMKDAAYWQALLADGAPACGAPVRMKTDGRGNRVPCVYCAKHAGLAFGPRIWGAASNNQLAAMAVATPPGRMHDSFESLGA